MILSIFDPVMNVSSILISRKKKTHYVIVVFLSMIGQDALMFLSNKPTMPYKIRYPSKCLQYAWQTILEQRLKTWQRSIHDESSSADSDLE